MDNDRDANGDAHEKATGMALPILRIVKLIKHILRNIQMYMTKNTITSRNEECTWTF